MPENQEEIRQAILTDEEVLASSPSDLSSKDFERYYALKEAEWTEIRKLPHKVVNGVPVALTQDEINKINTPEENYDKIILQNAKNSLINQRKKYLDDTDKKMLRAIDEGLSEYEEKKPRQKARNEIAAIKACETIEELKKFEEV